MDHCPFCGGEIDEHVAINGGTCGHCFAHIPGEDAATDPGEDVKQAVAAEFRKRARRRSLLPLLVTVPLVLGVVGGSAWLALRPAPEFVTMDLDDSKGEFYMPDLDQLLVAEVDEAPVTDAVEGGSDPGRRRVAATDSKEKGTPGLRRPNMGGTAEDDEALLADLGKQETEDLARMVREGKADLTPTGLDQGGSLTGGLTGASSAPGFQMDVNVTQSERPLSNQQNIARMVQGVLRKQLPRLRTCYEGSLRSNPELAGKWVLTFTIQTDGSVAKESVVGEDVQDAPMEQCIAQKIAKWRFHTITRPQPVKKTVDFTS